MVTRLPRPSVPRRPPLPGGVPTIEFAPLPELSAEDVAVDEFGLSVQIYGNFPFEQRRLIAKALVEMGGRKDARPPLGASIAETIMFGLLLDHEFLWRQGIIGGNRTFTFQSYELGGRQPGGSVVDFMVYWNGQSIAVRVQSVFHDKRAPFGGGGQVNVREVRLKQQLLAAHFIDRVVDVNEPPARVLETATNPIAVHNEMQRVLGRLPS